MGFYTVGGLRGLVVDHFRIVQISSTQLMIGFSLCRFTRVWFDINDIRVLFDFALKFWLHRVVRVDLEISYPWD